MNLEWSVYIYINSVWKIESTSIQAVHITNVFFAPSSPCLLTWLPWWKLRSIINLGVFSLPIIFSVAYSRALLEHYTFSLPHHHIFPHCWIILTNTTFSFILKNISLHLFPTPPTTHLLASWFQVLFLSLSIQSDQSVSLMSPKVVLEVTNDVHDIKMMVNSYSSSYLTCQFNLTHLITFSSLINFLCLVSRMPLSLSFLPILLIAPFQCPWLDPCLPDLILAY